MFIYQAVIMALVVILIYLLGFILKPKRRKLLVILMVAILVVGGVALYYVQYYFSNHYYTQPVTTSTIESVKFNSTDTDKIQKVFSDYEQIRDNSKNSDVFRKVYTVDGNGATSKIVANVYVFSNTSDASNYFSGGQSIYDNKNYIPLDPLKSKKDGSGTLYLISGIKSQYRDYTDLLYLPSKIDYCSDVVMQSDNVIITLSETSNKPVSNKDKVLNDIVSKIKTQG